MDRRHKSVGVVAGVVGPQQRFVVGYGRKAADDPRQPASRAGRGYETVVRERILEPLRMSDTAVLLMPLLRERLATGHDKSLEPVANWDFEAMAGAGALRSTVNDMLSFLEANLGLVASSLSEAMQTAHAPRSRLPGEDMTVGLGWIVDDRSDGRIMWHNGGTGGYSSFIGFDPDSRVGVVVLSNAEPLVDYLGFRLLDRAAATWDETGKERT